MTTTAAERQRYAIARSRRERAAERAALVAEVDRVVSEVGWSRARPVVVAVLGPDVPVFGPRGRRRRRLLRKCTAAHLLAAPGRPGTPGSLDHRSTRYRPPVKDEPFVTDQPLAGETGSPAEPYRVTFTSEAEGVETRRYVGGRTETVDTRTGAPVAPDPSGRW